MTKRELSPWMVFSMPALEKELLKNRSVKKIAVIGGSHSGALALKNILLVSDRLEANGLPRVIPHLLATDTPKFRFTDANRVVHNDGDGLDGNTALLITAITFDPETADNNMRVSGNTKL